MRGSPVFVLGITPRSGTGYIWRALATHPDLAQPIPMREDALLQESHHLAAYVAALEGFYRQHMGWGAHELVRNELPAFIGRALSGWLESQLPPGKRLLAKTPTVRNLGLFFDWFADAYLIVIVREAAAVAESSVRTFGWTYDEALRQWARGARTILEFESHLEPHLAARYRRVHYEELVDDPIAVTAALFRFVGCDADAADPDAIEGLPVRGSSTFRGDAEEIHWRPIPKAADFRPLCRAAHWGPDLRALYAKLAGEPARRLGYDVS